jgi:hypothetical protein
MFEKLTPVLVLPQLLVDVPGHGLDLSQRLLQVGLVTVTFRSVLDHVLQKQLVTEKQSLNRLLGLCQKT